MTTFETSLGTMHPHFMLREVSRRFSFRTSRAISQVRAAAAFHHTAACPSARSFGVAFLFLVQDFELDLLAAGGSDAPNRFGNVDVSLTDSASARA